MDNQLTLQEAIAIAKRTIEGTASVNEKEALRKFIDTYPREGRLVEQLFPVASWEQVSQRRLPAGMEHRLLQNILGRPARRRGVVRHFSRIAAAAVIIGVCVISSLILLSKRHADSGMTPKMALLSTQDGQLKSVVLEDGTRILLDGGTTLRFPENFTGGTREVFLDGEAFFDVAKDSLRPFIIHSPRVSTTVLGTSFSMRSASKDPVATIAVATGKVRVEAGSSAAAIVTPGEEAVYRSADASGIRKQPVNIAGIGAWKDHWFYYDHTSLKDILADLERAYGLHFRVRDTTVLNYTYNATFRNISTNSILQTLSLMGRVKFEKKNGFFEVTHN